jgi:hypothetical protein
MRRHVTAHHTNKQVNNGRGFNYHSRQEAEPFTIFLHRHVHRVIIQTPISISGRSG